MADCRPPDYVGRREREPMGRAPTCFFRRQVIINALRLSGIILYKKFILHIINMCKYLYIKNNQVLRLYCFACEYYREAWY